MENTQRLLTVPQATQQIVIRTSLTSPFGRKVRMAADVLELSDRVSVVHASTFDESDTLLQQNPLGKIPCLVTASGNAVYDSRVALEFLQDLAGTERLLPLRGPARFAMLTRMALADGIIDAGALILYEPRYHDPAAQSERWLAHQRGKILRALAAFEAGPPQSAETDGVAIGLSCALGFLDRRRPVEWRADHPRLAAWLEAFAEREPAFERTRPPAD
jgi:glutathione S-transferase